MKNLKAPFLVIALFLNILLVSAETSSHPPTPVTADSSTAKTMADGDCDPIFPECEDAFPINQNIIFLVVGGLALGLAVIYKNQIKKASV
ncbi:hypothetical protein [Flavobacterium sp. LHD-85]|uniref:hypothetical protein n=1 Tax=Flavobacterium sp. LHD-85 TaxID=3071410 RepID=UPI0027E0DF64|nr:hypothetical protein [Flavobacterium sp. LHD-85]MDQ6528944.1 hypothetical protein [Flavobacterium sp. LHD-85]